MIKNCEACGKLFEAVRNRKFCSPHCFRASRKVKLKRYKQTWKDKKLRTITPKIIEVINSDSQFCQSDSQIVQVDSLQTFSDLRKFITTLILKTRDGELDPKRAQAISSLLRPLIEVLQSEELEDRISELERVANKAWNY